MQVSGLYSSLLAHTLSHFQSFDNLFLFNTFFSLLQQKLKGSLLSARLQNG